MGLDAPRSGDVTVNGRHVHDMSWPLREVGALLESRSIHPGRSARAHLQMLAQTNSIQRARVDEVLEMTGLTSVSRRQAGTFPLAMTHRIGMAAALLGDPEVLLFDEPVNGLAMTGRIPAIVRVGPLGAVITNGPVNGLDPDGVRWVRNLLKGLAREGWRSSSPATSWPRWPSPPMRSSSAPAGGLHPGKIRPSALQAAPAQQRGDKHSFALKSSRHGGPVMNSQALGDPLAFMSFPERRRWRHVERRAVRERNAQQLTTLRILAATRGALTSLIYPDSGGYATSAEFIIAGTRIRAGCVHRPTLSALTQALGCMPTVALLTASRYGPYWVLTFELATAPLVVLVDKLSILPDRHGGSAPLAAPAAPVDGRHRSTRFRRYLNPG